MIHTRLDIPSIEQTITRPTIVGVLNDLSHIFNIDPRIRKDIANEFEEVSKIESHIRKPVDYTYGHNQNTYMVVTYDEDMNEDRVMTNPINKNMDNVILNQEDTGVVLKPIYYFTYLNINIKYKTKSQNEISKFINNLKLNYIKNRETHYHTVSTHIHIHDTLTEFLDIIYKIKENKHQTSKTFIEDILENTNNITIASNQKGVSKLVYKDIQTNTIGYFDNDISNIKTEYDKDTGFYYVDMTYKLSYNKPVYIRIQYPELIYNTLLPSKYLLMNDYVIENGKVILEDYLKIPKFDNHSLNVHKCGISPVFSILVIPDDNNCLCNLNDLPDFKLKDTVKDFLEAGEYQYVLTPYSSIIYIEFYENDTLLDSVEYLTIDSSLNICSKKPLDITKVYRVLVSLVTDGDYLDKEAIKRTIPTDVFNNIYTLLKDGREYTINYTPIKSVYSMFTVHVESMLSYT